MNLTSVELRLTELDLRTFLHVYRSPCFQTVMEQILCLASL